MPNAMTKEDGRLWRQRWREVNRAEIEELRARTAEESFAMLAILMRSARVMGWNERLAEGEEIVRERWVRLKQRGV